MTGVLFAAALVLAVAVLAALRGHRELVRWLGRDPYATRRWIRTALLGAAVALIAAAWIDAAQRPPRFSGAGIDVVLTIDVSRSMESDDTAPTRLRRAQRLAERLVLEARGARLGLVLFAGDAFAALPLTLDRDAHLAYLRALDSELISHRGTDLARALEVAASVFDPRSPRPRALVLLSDGEHAGRGLEDTLLSLKGQGIRVFAVGFGTLEGGLVPGPTGGPMFDRAGRALVSRRSDTLLEQVALATGGAYARELEDRPNPETLLPPPQELASDPEPATAGLFALAVAAAILALTAELWLATDGPLVPENLATILNRNLGTVLNRNFFEKVPIKDRPQVPDRRGRRAAAVLVLGLLLAACPGSWVEEGDRHFQNGEIQEALSLYRRMERTYGTAPGTQIRIGNALYRMEEPDRAAAAYLDALRHLQPQDQQARFVASFNLGDSLLEQQRYNEARDQFWGALRANPCSLEAKFNYEWSAQRSDPLELPPPPPVAQQNPSSAPGSGGEAPGGANSSAPSRPGAAARERTDAERRAAPQLSEAEARRWLETIEDSIEAPLRRQVTDSLGAGPRRRLGGQTW